ncbi:MULTISPECIES: hypothetical protein [Psychrilyobacter]|uniref:Uncharacterized protein n=1 Tax=Psychrilyobacter piezotolerans TaxID=2293438 RepID=A0ABX9KHA1_9FUSO|nr:MULTISPECIES: hypothetical protein [Psychrilyobacter]MCS5420680.1 hypothetical protein [Psychrilyobacter sp. S5]NDI77854.1 hypothetical protein [Psychrilyobacter piezotolerans]RDE62292.1 hypothetical protein DV867_06905 [Psychrilyobacter sp. S5]REI41390.1 hypothetical protein DYH56_06905 [Psychrilyobacter piezotolerans]
MKKIIIALLFIILISSLSNSNAADKNDEHWNRKFETYYHNIKDNLNFISTFKEEYQLKKNLEFHRDKMNKIDKLRSTALTGEELNSLDNRYSQAQAEIKLGEIKLNKIYKESGWITKNVVSPLMDTWIDIYDVTDKGDMISRITVIAAALILTVVLIFASILIISFI